MIPVVWGFEYHSRDACRVRRVRGILRPTDERAREHALLKIDDRINASPPHLSSSSSLSCLRLNLQIYSWHRKKMQMAVMVW